MYVATARVYVDVGKPFLRMNVGKCVTGDVRRDREDERREMCQEMVVAVAALLRAVKVLERVVEIRGDIVGRENRFR
jgi:hypothetical protein